MGNPRSHHDQQAEEVRLPRGIPLRYTKTDAFKFENVKVQLVDRKARPVPKPDEHFHETLYLGDLRDICRIRVF
jgi:hypothetical protein